MAEFVGGEPVSVGVDEPITFENKTDTAFDVGCGIVFRKSGLYRVSITGRHMSVAVEPERKKGKWIHERLASTTGGSYPVVRCSICQNTMPFEWETHYCPNCGADMRGEQNEN